MLLLYTFSKGVQFVLWLSGVSCGFTVFIEPPRIGGTNRLQKQVLITGLGLGIWELEVPKGALWESALSVGSLHEGFRMPKPPKRPFCSGLGYWCRSRFHGLWLLPP